MLWKSGPNSSLRPSDQRLATCKVCAFQWAERVLIGFDLNYSTSTSAHSIFNCPRCGIAFTTPELSETQLAAAYPRNYHVWGGSLAWLGKKRRDLLRTTAWLSGSGTYATLFYPDVIEPRRFGLPARVLEVGCGNGAGLAVLREAGWDAVGVEPDPQAASRARSKGLTVIQCHLEECALEKGHYDVIILHHVLEHLTDLNRGLDLVVAALAPKGRLYIGVPNFSSGPRRFFGPSWSLLDLPRHRFHFSPSALRSVLGKHGLKVVDEFHTAGVESIIQSWVNLYLNRKASAGPGYRPGRVVIRFRQALSRSLGPVLSAIFGRFLLRVATQNGSTFGLIVEES